jgi:threonine dehydrogenase-like Zn-dependent dehydrogenase
VAILGPGHLGLASIVAARAAGAERIFITGTASDALRLDAARTLGVEEAVNISDTDPLARIRELTGDGVDDALSLLAREAPGRDAVRLALRLTD